MIDPETGQTRRKTWYGDTEAEARSKMVDALADYRKGAPVRAGRELTLRGWYELWLADLQVRLRTRLRYVQCMAHVLPVLGDRPLSRITPTAVSALIRQLHREGAPTTRTKAKKKGDPVQHRPLKTRGANRVRDVLRNCLAEAQRQGRVNRNAAALARPLPEDDVVEMQTLDPAKVAVFLDLAANDPDGSLWVFSLATGTRLGEAQGLTATNVIGYADDFPKEMGVAQIRQEISRVQGRWLIEPPKTKRGRRDIRLPEAAIEALRRERARQAELQLVAKVWPAPFDGASTIRDPPKTFAGFLFLAENGQPRNPPAVSRRMKQAMRKAGIDPIRFHDLRHSAGSWQHALGVPIAEISKNLGHSRNSTTYDMYVHATDRTGSLTAEAMNRALRGA